MNAASIVKLSSAGWQVPQVRPLPAKVSLKKMRRPLAISAACGSVGGGIVSHAATSAAIDASMAARPHMACVLIGASAFAWYGPPSNAGSERSRQRTVARAIALSGGASDGSTTIRLPRARARGIAAPLASSLLR